MTVYHYLAYILSFICFTVVYIVKTKRLKAKLNTQYENRLYENKRLLKELENKESAIKAYERHVTDLGIKIQDLLDIKNPKKPLNLFYLASSYKGTVQKTIEERKKIEPQIYKIIRDFEFKTKCSVVSIDCEKYEHENPANKWYSTKSIKINLTNPFEA